MRQYHVKLFIVLAFSCLLGLRLEAAWRTVLETVDSQGEVGKYTSLKVDAQGYPRIAYHDTTSGALKYAAWNGTSWDIENVDAAGNAGQYASLVLDSSGNPHISYYGESALKYASWSGSDWTVQTIDTGSPAAYGDTSLALDSLGNPHIAYVSVTNNVLTTIVEHKYAQWTGVAWSTSTIDDHATIESSLSLALDKNDGPHVAYYDAVDYNLKYAQKNGSSWDIQTVDPVRNRGLYACVAVDTNSYPCIAYFDSISGDLKYGRWNGAAWDLRNIDDTGWVGQYPSLIFDSSGMPHVSYYGEYALKYGKWDGTAWVTKAIDAAPGSSGYVGQYSSVAIDSMNVVHVSYYDDVNRDLKYARIYWTLDVSFSRNDMAVYHPVFRSSLNEKATIKYTIVSATNMELIVYDYFGRKVATIESGTQQPGFYTVEWDGTDDNGAHVASGTYLLYFNTGTSSLVKKMVVVR